jgi:hypothetical protein
LKYITAQKEENCNRKGNYEGIQKYLPKIYNKTKQKGLCNVFENFRLARYRITITAGKDGLSLPPYKGSTFRGGFGGVFRRIVCSMRLSLPLMP